MQKDQEIQITLQNVTDWTLGNADPAIARRIEDDLKRPDSEVKEYLDWVADASEKLPRRSGLPTPRIVQRDQEALFAAAGGRQSFMERLRKAIEETPGPRPDRGR